MDLGFGGTIRDKWRQLTNTTSTVRANLVDPYLQVMLDNAKVRQLHNLIMQVPSEYYCRRTRLLLSILLNMMWLEQLSDDCMLLC